MSQLNEAAAAVARRNIRVAFGPVVANDDVSFAVEPGEIHALLGENGAGKTTLMRALAGLLQPQAGSIEIGGQPVVIDGPLEARRLGIGMVHQHFMLVPTLTVAENIALGLREVRTWFPRLDQLADEIDALGARYGLAVNARALAGELSVASQQRVEIVKALYRGAKILVLDEPTAVLTPQEAAALFPVLRSLAAAGTAIVFISHKLNEVMAVTDRITVLRRGKVAGSLRTAETEPREIARLMVGGEVTLPQLEGMPTPGRPLLEVDRLGLTDARGVRRLEAVSLSVGAGEIVAVAGVDGNGQQELAEAIVGLQRPDTGRVLIDGVEMTNRPVAEGIAAGLAHIPEDRHRTAIFERMSVTDNAVAEEAGRPRFARWGMRRRGETQAFAAQLVADYDVRLGSVEQAIGSLSGGNQQKVVLGRALSRDPRLLVAVQPTRGLDIGATAFLQSQLLQRRAAGAAVLLISTELDEVLALADRIVVLFKGRVTGVVARADFSVEQLGLLMAGRTA
ncbi:ABC transporter ATP-binding protein [Devosia insulae]|uniref:ABC transporter ATP-binding protein n=1 Tax=Devosia insulae TaxID=408174 RepID=UPI0009FE35D1|nr:ABC transporter ATP-binding protein [Devosia insulae]